LERTLPAPPGDALDVTATNVPTPRSTCPAHVDCNAMLKITTDGRITISLTGCNRTVQAD
jgi:hypothetical protein